MKNIEQLLTDAGIELTDEQRNAIVKGVKENYKTIAEHEKVTGKLTAETEALKTQYEEAKTALTGFDGVDIEALKKQIEEANARVTKAEEDARNQIAARDYKDIVNSHVSGLAFSSTSAKERFIEKLTEKNLPIEDGRLLGFDDYVESYKTHDEGAIVDKEAQENKAKFTDKMQGGNSTVIGKEEEMLRKMLSAAGVKEKE